MFTVQCVIHISSHKPWNILHPITFSWKLLPQSSPSPVPDSTFAQAIRQWHNHSVCQLRSKFIPINTTVPATWCPSWNPWQQWAHPHPSVKAVQQWHTWQWPIQHYFLCSAGFKLQPAFYSGAHRKHPSSFSQMWQGVSIYQGMLLPVASSNKWNQKPQPRIWSSSHRTTSKLNFGQVKKCLALPVFKSTRQVERWEQAIQEGTQ